jgi:hypothetical protein
LDLPEAAVWRSCGTRGSTGPRPESGLSHSLTSDISYTTLVPPSNLVHTPSKDKSTNNASYMQQKDESRNKVCLSYIGALYGNKLLKFFN